MIPHADEWPLLVADKPRRPASGAGRPVELHDCLWQRVRAIVSTMRWWCTASTWQPRAWCCSRADIEVQRALSRAFAQREVDKRYEAVVAGTLEDVSGEIDLPWRADWPNRPRQRSTASTASRR